MSYPASAGGAGTSREQKKQAAPFISKMYEMVSNPSSDNLIRWGKDNNTFLLLEPSRFSQRLLPSYFRHRNFSSFIRQLNIYGFRKVDPDRWEFAHESFLKGQIHLLPLIGRKSGKSKGNDALMIELGRLKEEQRALEEGIEGVSRRLSDTERRPMEVMSLLMELAKDLGLEEREARGETKRRRLGEEMSSPEMSSPELKGPPGNEGYPFCLLGRGFFY